MYMPEEVRTAVIFHNVIIVGMTGFALSNVKRNAFTEDVILAKSAGMNEHIAKPLDMEKLNRMLHEWM